MQSILESLPIEQLEAAEQRVYGKSMTPMYTPEATLSFTGCPPVDEDQLMKDNVTVEKILKDLM